MLPNVRAFADGEIDLVRAICLARLKAVQASAIALVAAALLCLSALTALLVGLVIALGPIIGPFVATFAVSLGALAVGAIIAIYAAGRLKAVFSAPIMDETREPQESYGHDPAQRSEEHTSELQSLMRISYAVFCLKQNNTQINLMTQ